MAGELSERADGYREAVLAHLTLLLVEVARLAADVVGDLRVNREPLLADVFAVIERRYAEPLSLRDVARAVSLSAGHLTTVVRRRTGRTVQEWIVDRRMTAARRLLAGSDLPVGEIGRRVGYPDPGYFARVFGQVHGVSPTRWRSGWLTPLRAVGRSAVAAHLVVAGGEHVLERGLGGGVHRAGLRQVGVALQVGDGLHGLLVHRAGDRALVVVELAQLPLQHDDRFARARAGVTGVTWWWVVELDGHDDRGCVAPLAAGVAEPNAAEAERQARDDRRARDGAAERDEDGAAGGRGRPGWWGWRWLRVEVVVLMAAAPGFRWSRGVSPMAQDCSAAAVRTVDRAADAAGGSAPSSDRWTRAHLSTARDRRSSNVRESRHRRT